MEATTADSGESERLATLPGGTRAPLTLEQPGRYVLQKELARGGQSIVHLAYDVHVGRQIAFKQLLPSRRDTLTADSLSPSEARFVREARITAQLDHPGIAPIHEVGRRADGSLYATQKLVRGRTLEGALAACSSLRDRLALLQPMLGVCQAVAYAHERGVIHRDLKPGNVMLGELGETVVLDWGLARTSDVAADEQPQPQPPVTSLLESEVGRTREGSIMGTPAYMSPEQAIGATARIDTRSDVWSLGVVLYELLTGKRPFEGRTTEELLMAIATASVAPVRVACPDAPAELAAVAERALARDPARRYPAAKDLADDLAAWLSGGRVVAHEYTSLELLRKFIARNRTAALFVTILLGVMVGAAIAWRNKYLEARSNLASAFLEKARAAQEQLKWADAAAFYAASRLYQDTPEVRLGLAASRERAARPIFSAKIADLHDVAFLPDGRVVAAVKENDAIAVRLLESRQQVARFPCTRLLLARFLHGGSWLAARTIGPPEGPKYENNSIETWDVLSGRAVGARVVSRIRGYYHTRWAEDGSAVAVPTFPPRERLIVYSTRDGSELMSREIAKRRFALSPDGSKVVLVEQDDAIVVRELPSGRLLQSLHTEHVPTWFHSDGETILLFSPRGRISIWDLKTNRFEEFDQAQRPGYVWPISTESGTVFAYNGKTFSIWDMDTRAQRLQQPARLTNSVLARDGKRLLTVNEGGEVTLWQLPVGAGKPRPGVVGWPRDSGSITLSRNGRRLALYGQGHRSVRVLDFDSGAELARFDVRAERLGSSSQSLSFSDDGGRLAVYNDLVTNVYDLSPQPRQVASFDFGPEKPLSAPPVSLSPDGKAILTKLQDEKKRWGMGLRSVATGEILWATSFGSIATDFSADGRFIALSSNDQKVIRILDAQTGKALRTISTDHGLTDGVLIFSSDGSRIATAGGDDVDVFETGTGQRQLRLSTGQRVGAVAFSPDGRFIASAGVDRSDLWDARTGQHLLRMPSNLVVHSVAFTPDSKKMLFADDLQWIDVHPPADLPPPEEALREVLAEFKLSLEGTELQPLP